MASLYLNGLTADERKELIAKLHQAQHGNCFICESPIDLDLHANATDIDHVESLKAGGKDDSSNFALTHSSCNRSKQATDLRVARILARFSAIRAAVAPENRGPNLSDVLARYSGAAHDLPLKIDGDSVRFSFPELGRNDIVAVPLYTDSLSGFRYFFACLPIAYLFHDDRINPRSVGSNIGKLVDEFHHKRPQLHVSLAWVSLEPGETKSRVRVFDGQHKATAQVLLGVKEIGVRIFVNPDKDVLLTANTNAGTTLKQVAFDKSVQRHLGSALFADRLERYRKDRNLPDDAEEFSEKDLINHFRGEWREMGRYILDNVRNSITHNSENKLRDFIDLGGKGSERPLSYSTVEKTFFSFFIYPNTLETPLNFYLDQGENPRELEKEQILRLMNLIAERFYVGRFDLTLGTARIEHRIQKGDEIPEGHLVAFRLSKEEILYNWLGFIRDIAKNYFVTTGRIVNDQKLFQYRFPDTLWDNIGNFLANLRGLPLWVNYDLSLSVFGGKQNYEYWQKIFESGKTPQGQQIMPEGINLIKMIQP